MSTLAWVLFWTLGVPFAYLGVGVGWSRTQAIRLQTVLTAARKRYDELRERGRSYEAPLPWFAKTKSWEDDLRAGLAWHALGWPVSMSCRLGYAATSFAVAPVEKRRVEVETLKAEVKQLGEMVDNRDLPGDERALLLDLMKQKQQEAKDRAL